MIDHRHTIDQEAPSRRRWPYNASSIREIQSATGLTFDEVWLMQEASGNLVGAIAGTTLTASGTPTYQSASRRRAGVLYDATTDYHSAAVFPFGTGSAWVGFVIEIGTADGLPAIGGRSDPGANDTALVYLQTAPNYWPTTLVRDSGSNSLLLGDSVDLRTIDTVWFVQLQIDRASGSARSRWSPLNRAAPKQFQGSISGFATLDSGDEVFHLGGFDAFGGGINVLWAAVARGTQCAGETLLPKVARAMGIEGPRASWPNSPAVMNAAMGGYGSWASGWQCDESNGSLTDAWGGITLAPSSTPTYGNAGPLNGDFAVGFDDASADAFSASSTSTYDITASDSIALYCCVKPTTMANRNFMGKVSGIDGYAIQGEVSKMQAFIGDGVAFAQNVVNANHVGDWCDILFCVDRTNQRAQLFTNLGTSTALDISAIGNPNNAGAFTLGAFTSMFASTVAFAAVATGDIANLRANGAAAIAAIRSFTGRA
jgi:hypothetical protein